MAKSTVVTSETLCAAVITQGSIRKAARHLKISDSAAYSIAKSDEYKILYENAQADILNESVKVVQGKMTDAINTIAEIMSDKEINAQTRLLAAQSIVNTNLKLAQAYATQKEKAARISVTNWDFDSNF